MLPRHFSPQYLNYFYYKFINWEKITNIDKKDIRLQSILLDAQVKIDVSAKWWEYSD